MELICSISVDFNLEKNVRELVVRGPDGLEFRDPLSEDGVDAQRIWYALLHDCII